MPKRLYECTVCGRKFPEGQGIIISRGGVVLYFHSSRCAAKFLKALIESSDDCIIEDLKRTAEEFRRAIEAKRKRVEKKI
ncbi:MAG: hypothetical protein F7C33_04905 [Desulfurococcales archaeon]|nr:hypothetical protein [Desulfurococcales archaeon]